MLFTIITFTLIIIVILRSVSYLDSILSNMSEKRLVNGGHLTLLAFHTGCARDSVSVLAEWNKQTARAFASFDSTANKTYFC